jgi:hypothetical protein
MNELEKEFVPHQESLELKELGFDKPCFGWWFMDEEMLIIEKSKKSTSENIIQAPTWYQAFRFFRKKHNLKSWVQEHTADTFIYEIRPHKLTDYREGEVYVYEEYEQAELACLRKLIEIVKNK